MTNPMINPQQPNYSGVTIQISNPAVNLGRNCSIPNTPQGYQVQGYQDIPQGVYQFSFTSALPTNFGMNYLPLEVEVYLLNRSGRDETGYFAPLE